MLPLVLHYCSLFFLYCRFSGAVDRLSIVAGSGHCVEPFIIAHSYIFVYQAGVCTGECVGGYNCPSVNTSPSAGIYIHAIGYK